MTKKQQVINAHKRGLSVKLIAECSHLTEKQVKNIIKKEYKNGQEIHDNKR